MWKVVSAYFNIFKNIFCRPKQIQLKFNKSVKYFSVFEIYPPAPSLADKKSSAKKFGSNEKLEPPPLRMKMKIFYRLRKMGKLDELDFIAFSSSNRIQIHLENCRIVGDYCVLCSVGLRLYVVAYLYMQFHVKAYFLFML